MSTPSKAVVDKVNSLWLKNRVRLRESRQKMKDLSPSTAPKEHTEAWLEVQIRTEVEQDVEELASILGVEL